MFLSKIAAVASLGLLLSFAAGCAASASDDSAASQAALENVSDEGEFTLSDGARPMDPECSEVTELNLAHDRTDGVLHAHLHDAMNGTCRRFVAADHREYVLTLEENTLCGSKVYTATTKVKGELSTIKITDNRSRICDDFVPAIVIQESRSKGSVRTLHAQ